MYKTRNILPELFTQAGYDTGVEVGVQRGDFADVIAQGWTGTMYLVDPWKQVTAFLYPDDHDENYRYVRERFSGMDRIKPMRSLSVEAAATFADGSLDWVYLDADHAYDSIKADLRAWWPKVRIGGMFCGHDYFTDEGFDVVRAVDEFAAEKSLNLQLIEDWPPSWLFQK